MKWKIGIVPGLFSAPSVLWWTSESEVAVVGGVSFFSVFLT